MTYTNESASIDLSFVPTYSSSIVTIQKDDVNLGLASSDVTISFDAGTQSTIVLIVTNPDSGVKLEYDLTVIRPYAECDNLQLTDW